MNVSVGRAQSQGKTRLMRSIKANFELRSPNEESMTKHEKCLDRITGQKRIKDRE